MHVRRFCALLGGLLLSASVFAQEAPQPQTEQTPPAPQAAAQPAQPEQPPAPPRDLPQVLIKTTMGDILVELDIDKAPVTVDNFLKYVKAGYYNNTIFHRVIPRFMIQTGGYTKDLKEKKGLRKAIVSESKNGLPNVAYSLAMARQANPNSAQSQFFINTVDNPGLDPEYAQDHVGYAVFGRVIKGQEVVDKIKAVRTDDVNPQFHDVPISPITITGTSIVKQVK